jgi:hypothetical protein
MNPGYISLIATWFTLLFIWLGWMDPFFRKYGISKAFTVGLLFVLLLGMHIEIPFEYGNISFLGFSIPLIFGSLLWLRQTDRYRLHLLTASFLVGTSLFFLQLLIRVDPILMIVDEKYMLATLVLVLIVLTTKSPIQQLILLSFSFAINDLLLQTYLLDKTGMVFLGSPEWRDIWWVSFYSLIFTIKLLKLVKVILPFCRKRTETTS